MALDTGTEKIEREGNMIYEFGSIGEVVRDGTEGKEGV